ncbi:M15 family metallopeptidase [Noviherbaspirillum saxi]|uniref:D-alanyl-D-alanine carboxypeptidase family protein n=1 Tax=Noviherbaspirillum saxi TaxID=2320863 RepID=A0A3A3G1B5_9BURK|nr:M15 family metallopeptidase [Noviherbaspirillum saxi]RJF95226.1 D-alanyl-D-alanine carboxypeptidase family protein [Noviherbaspirillum saxi]
MHSLHSHTATPIDDYESRVAEALAALGIPEAAVARTGLPFHREAAHLAIAETASDGEEHLLIPPAAAAWKEMKAEAGRDGIGLYVVSAYRDLASQSAIVREKMERGMPLATIFTLSAPPGYSEHHTGRAVDINTPGCVPREEPFEHTAAFGWLSDRAKDFGFVLSYPRHNASGFSYEPWHWYYT